jgi:TolB-like protein/DNA-binding winged helix-turn-helix (wHTH) protein/Tfp pilus assembly protein PilF
VIRFATFEVDLRSGELRRDGLKIRLQEQPFRILAMLLERPGEVVAREEVRKKLWSEDTFVDFEHSLATAVKKLREALGDDADNPRFVETLPRRGYRFIAPVAAASPTAGVRWTPSESRDRTPPPEAVEAISYRHPRRGDVKSPLQRRLAVAGGAIMAIFATLLALNVAGLRERLLRAVAAVSDRRTAVGTPPLQKIESLAVLPLENLSGDPEQEYFADGMTDQLITELGQISALKVISRASVMRYKEIRKSVREIARDLNAEGVVQGSVLRAGGRVRITVQLTDVMTDTNLWGRSYERDLRDVLTLQEEVAAAIARQIRSRLTPREQTRLARARAVNPEAHEAYLKGLYFLNMWSEREIQKALGYFQQAIEIDPRYALGYVGIANSNLLLGVNVMLPPNETIPKAKAAALRALELDDTLGEAHTALAQARKSAWDWEGAEAEFQRAIELNPNDAMAHHWYSQLLTQSGRHEEAIAEAKLAAQLDPIWMTPLLGTALFMARRHDEAIPTLLRAADLNPNSMAAHYLLGEFYAGDGELEKALPELRKAVALGGTPFGFAGSGFAYARSGNKREAAKVLKQLGELSKKSYVSDYLFALIYVGMREDDRAIEWLQKAYRQHDSWLPWVNVSPHFDPLRSDPRFQDLLRRMNFPP